MSLLCVIACIIAASVLFFAFHVFNVYSEHRYPDTDIIGCNHTAHGLPVYSILLRFDDFLCFYAIDPENFTIDDEDCSPCLFYTGLEDRIIHIYFKFRDFALFVAWIGERAELKERNDYNETLRLFLGKYMIDDFREESDETKDHP